MIKFSNWWVLEVLNHGSKRCPSIIPSAGYSVNPCAAAYKVVQQVVGLCKYMQTCRRLAHCDGLISLGMQKYSSGWLFVTTSTHLALQCIKKLEPLLLGVEVGGTNDDVTKWEHFPRYWPFVLGIPSQRPFDVFFDLRLNKPMSEQSWGWWFETSSCSLWRHCNENQLRGVKKWPNYTVSMLWSYVFVVIQYIYVSYWLIVSIDITSGLVLIGWLIYPLVVLLI